MEKEQNGQYTVNDIYEAFDLGLSTAVYVFETSIGLSDEDQRDRLEGLKKMLIGVRNLEVVQSPCEEQLPS
jgi:hypothetical protein